MAVSLTWSSPTAAQADGGLALVTGNTLTQTSWQGLVSNVYLLSQLPTGPGYLTYSSATQVVFKVNRGAVVRIAGALYTLTADITAPNTATLIDGASGNLGSSTLYYVYLMVSAGVPVIDFSTTGWAIDTTSGNIGTAIKSGASSRTLIGMLRTNSSSQFSASPTQILSWYNRKLKTEVGSFSTNRSTTSSSYAELNSEIRVNYLMWADTGTGTSISPTALIEFTGVLSNGTAGTDIGAFSIGIDGTTAEDVWVRYATAGAVPVALTLTKNGHSEGNHYATVLGKIAGGATLEALVDANSAGNRPTLRVTVEG